MSADNGIYIGKFPDGIRVIHAQAIENCDYSEIPPYVTRAYRVQYWGNAPCFETIDEAMTCAVAMAEKTYTEYGICVETYSEPLARLTQTEAEEVLAHYWEVFRSKKQSICSSSQSSPGT